jgi:hypothetical protein
MGYSTGNMITVSFEEAEKVAGSVGSSVGQVLGLIIAHEVGHLLLGRNHSPGGIMRARWGLNDWVLAGQGELVFLPQQAAAMRTKLNASGGKVHLRRNCHQSSLKEVTGGRHRDCENARQSNA